MGRGMGRGGEVAAQFNSSQVKPIHFGLQKKIEGVIAKIDDARYTRSLEAACCRAPSGGPEMGLRGWGEEGVAKL